MSDALFTQAPDEVIRYFETKTSRPSFDWRDVAPAEHAYTFTVAKSHGFDVLDDIRSAVDDAIRNQESFETFRAKLQPILEEKGWWGRKVATDPTDGRLQVAQLGSPRRLRTIHWANVSTARAAGEWERIQRTKAFLPYLRYGRSTSERRRPLHASWEGTILPADHSWWAIHYPPNGWGCECPVTQLSRAQARREGYDPDNPPSAPEDGTYSWFNKRTGQRIDVPRGIDPGWAQNPGQNRMRNSTEVLAGSIDRLPLSARAPAIADYLASPAFAKIRDEALRSGARRQAAIAAAKADGVTNAGALLAVANEAAPIPRGRFAVATIPTRFDEASPTLFIDAETIGHGGKRYQETEIRKALYAGIQQTLLKGQAKRDGDTVRIFDRDQGLFIVMIKQKNGWRVRTAFPRKRDGGYLDRQMGDWVD